MQLFFNYPLFSFSTSAIFHLKLKVSFTRPHLERWVGKNKKLETYLKPSTTPQVRIIILYSSCFMKQNISQDLFLCQYSFSRTLRFLFLHLSPRKTFSIHFGVYRWEEGWKNQRPFLYSQQPHRRKSGKKVYI